MNKQDLTYEYERRGSQHKAMSLCDSMVNMRRAMDDASGLQNLKADEMGALLNRNGDYVHLQHRGRVLKPMSSRNDLRPSVDSDDVPAPNN